jgi:NCAIR mutase (PurE)-related protein
VAELLAEPAGQPVLLTRADPDQAAAAMARSPGGRRTLTGQAGTRGPERAGADLSLVAWRPASERPGRVLVVTAGTADLPVAEECDATLAALGLRPELLTDCGVAGIHRLLVSADDLAEADAVVVVAGMEGALASLVAGVTAAPVVAVPTSTGYGAAFEGIAALLSMLSSCAAGVTVVGIDNGFGAACAVSRLLG